MFKSGSLSFTFLYLSNAQMSCILDFFLYSILLHSTIKNNNGFSLDSSSCPSRPSSYPFVFLLSCPQLNSSGLLGNTELNVAVAIACFLAQEGADVSYANHKGKSPLDLVADSTMLQLIKNFSEKHRLQRLQAITSGQGLSSASLRRVHTTPNTMTNLVFPTPPGPSECLICSELALLVLFCPCQHSVACEECAHRMKKCIKCQVTITKKIRQDQTEVDCSPGTENSEQHNLLEQLQSRYRQMEERITCPICIDNHIKLVFQCGHASCIDCSAALKTCPICRQTIRERIQLFV
ncbi:E3 ubiquitin-protein ligase mib2 [Characodon lateralis]|uniref:E3 ubiquitin-protein ligase mib2 n=1 Tax=Characodon lateralis TaxID=208331 RepID=A0ABU7DJL8_9TELE|nr:E3 ubiquitin-protein ligase mib2 [Characodon lateralis]